MPLKILSLLILALIIPAYSCGKKDSTPVTPVKKELKQPKGSPTKVVEKFLEALKDQDFDKAFKYLEIPYIDKEGYVTQMKYTVSDNQVSFLKYQLLGTRIYKVTAVVMAELTVKHKDPKSGMIVERVTTNQYGLGAFNDKWKITSDDCIKNCSDQESGQIRIELEE